MALDAQKLFNEELPAAMAKNADAARAIGAKVQLNLEGEGGGQWLIDCSATGPSITAGSPGGADATVKVSVADFATLLENPQANGIKLFFFGKLKVDGNPMIATKLIKLLELRGQ